MPDFNAIATYSLFHPVGVFLLVVILVFSTWLCARVRSRLGWTMYGALTALLLAPAVIAIRSCYATLCDLGQGLAMLVTVPLAAAWLFGLLLGLLFHFLRKHQPRSH